jgi:hypothetical protein
MNVFTTHKVYGSPDRNSIRANGLLEGKRNKAIKEIHESLGHAGIKKTIDAIRKTFFWDRMGRDVEKFVNGCNKCNEHNAENSQIATPLVQPTKEWELIS